MAAPQPGVWGIDLGQCALKAIRLQEVDGEVKATAFDYVEHPKILSQPDADPDQLTREALEQFLSRNKLKGDIVVISVPGQTGLARFVKLPPVEEKKVAEIVKFEAKQQIPFPLEEVVWDFQKIGSGEVTDGFALETEIGLFAMKRDMVNRAIQQFRDVGVEIHIVQMAPLSLCNFVSYEQLKKDAGAAPSEDADQACVVALEIGTDNSNLIITDGNKIIWQRPIPLGGNHFTRALTKDLKLTFAKAEHLKRNAIKSPDLKKILASLKTVLNDFVGEVQRSLGYFTNTHRNAKIEYMLGLGNAFRLPGLQKYLQEKLQLEVRKLTKLERITGDEVLAAPQFSENILTFSVAVGLALQGLRKSHIYTNLLPNEIKFERLVRAKKPWAAAAVAALILAIAGITFASSIEFGAVKNKKLDDAIALSKKAIDEANALNKQYDDEVAKIDASKKAIDLIGAGVDQRLNWRLLYQYVNMALPRPDGSNLSKRAVSGRNVLETYVTNQAKEALQMLDERRFANVEGVENAKKPEQRRKEEEQIKKNLIQINVEGVNALYTEDVPAFFKAISEKNTFRGMEPRIELPLAKELRAGKKREELDESVKKVVPEKAWIIEIRGYAYHNKKADFVEDTILENLARPEKMFQGKEGKLPPDLVKKVQERVRFLFLYQLETIENVRPGQFALIGSSSLPGLIAGGKDKGGSGPVPGGGPMGAEGMGSGAPVEGGVPKVDRSGWAPTGPVASSVLKGGGGGGAPGVPDAVPMGPPIMPGKGDGIFKKDDIVVAPRTEFIIFFVWNEPVLAWDATAKVGE